MLIISTPKGCFLFRTVELKYVISMIEEIIKIKICSQGYAFVGKDCV